MLISLLKPLQANEHKKTHETFKMLESHKGE